MDMLNRRATTTAEIITNTSVFDDNTGRQVDTETYTSVGKCIFFEGASAKGLSNSKMRESVSATACFKPNVVILGDRMRINLKKEYSIIGQEDVANQGQVLKVYLGEIA